MRRSDWIGETQEAQLHQECNEVIAILISKMRSLDAQSTAGSFRETDAFYDIDQHGDRPVFPFVAADYRANP